MAFRLSWETASTRISGVFASWGSAAYGLPTAQLSIATASPFEDGGAALAAGAWGWAPSRASPLQAVASAAGTGWEVSSISKAPNQPSNRQTSRLSHQRQLRQTGCRPRRGLPLDGGTSCAQACSCDW